MWIFFQLYCLICLFFLFFLVAVIRMQTAKELSEPATILTMEQLLKLRWSPNHVCMKLNVQLINEEHAKVCSKHRDKYSKFHFTAVPVTPRYSSRRATTSGENHQLQDLYPDVQVEPVYWNIFTIKRNLHVNLFHDIFFVAELVSVIKRYLGKSSHPQGATWTTSHGLRVRSSGLILQQEGKAERDRSCSSNKQVATLTQNVLLMPVTTMVHKHSCWHEEELLSLGTLLYFLPFLMFSTLEQHPSCSGKPLCAAAGGWPHLLRDDGSYKGGSAQVLQP